MWRSHCDSHQLGLRRHAFTLAEMLVVLLVLSLLTVMAVQSLSPVADQARYEATTRALTEIQRAIIGQNEPTTITGFVADTGRLPTSLDELLLVQPSDVPPFELIDVPSALTPHENLKVPRGWRGPYLQLPIGASQFADGWGLAFDFTPTPLPPSVPTQLLIESPPDARAATDYAGDISISIGPNGTTEWRATSISGTVYKLVDNSRVLPTEPADWRVSLIGPGSVGTLDDISVPSLVSDGVSVQRATVNAESSYSISANLSVGPRVLQAFNSTNDRLGQPVYLTLRPGATHSVDLLVFE